MAASWMNLWSRLRANLGIGTSVTHGYLPMIRGAEAEAAPGDPTSLPAVYSCCSLLADSLVSLQWTVVRSSAAYNGVEPVTGHPANAALARWSLNDRWSWLWAALTSGNGIAHVADGTIEVFPCERAQLRIYSDNSIRYGLVPPVGGPVVEVSAEDCAVLRFRPSSRDQRIGISPLLTCSPAVDLLLTERMTANAILRNSARPGGVLTTASRIDAQRAENIKERWNRAFQGPTQAGATVVLEEGLSWEKLDLLDLQKLSFVEASNLGVQEISRLYGVPPPLLAADIASRASAVEARRWLLAFSVSPLCRLVEDALAQVLLTAPERAAGLKIQCDDSGTMLGQGTELADAASKLLNGGALTVNEVRDLMSYAPLPGGDVLRSPSNTFPIDSWVDWAPASASETNGSALDRAAPPSRRRITAQARLLQIRDDLLGPDAP